MERLSLRTTQKEQFVNITAQVRNFVAGSGVKDGVCTVFVPHTTAGVTINEGADPDVVRDILMALERLVPESWPYRHLEGNSTAHIKASMMGSSVQILVQGGALQLGTWQAIFFCEFDGPRQRQCWIDIQAAR